MGSTIAFINQQLGAAREAASRLGIPTSVVLAQWINETGSGSSAAFTQANNYAGVSTLDQPEQAVGASLFEGGPLLAYPTQAAGVAGYISRWLEPVYAPTRRVWATTSDPTAVAQSVEASPWAQGHYGGNGLEQLISQYNLTAYDDPSVDPNAPGPSTSSSSTSSTATGTAATLTSFPGGNLDPLNWVGSVLGGAKADVLKIVLTGAFVTAGLVLIVGGFWRAASPHVQNVTQQAAQAAPLAAAAG